MKTTNTSPAHASVAAERAAPRRARANFFANVKIGARLALGIADFA